MEIKKFLLPCDGSLHSINAAHYTLNFAKIFGAHVTIVNCFEWKASILELPSPLIVPSPLITDQESTSKRNAEDILKTAGEIFADQGIEYQLKTIYGSPSRVLANLAKHKEYDLIIMGSHGHSNIASLFIGSVTHQVLNTIYCPVLIVP